MTVLGSCLEVSLWGILALAARAQDCKATARSKVIVEEGNLRGERAAKVLVRTQEKAKKKRRKRCRDFGEGWSRCELFWTTAARATSTFKPSAWTMEANSTPLFNR